MFHKESETSDMNSMICCKKAESGTVWIQAYAFPTGRNSITRLYAQEMVLWSVVAPSKDNKSAIK